MKLRGELTATIITYKRFNVEEFIKGANELCNYDDFEVVEIKSSHSSSFEPTRTASISMKNKKCNLDIYFEQPNSNNIIKIVNITLYGEDITESKLLDITDRIKSVFEIKEIEDLNALWHEKG